MAQVMDGKVAFVTGGSRGIGAAIVRELAAAGARVAFTYARSEEAARNLAKELQGHGHDVIAVQADSTEPGAVTQAVESTVTRFGRFDILVNNAGVFPYGDPASFTDAEIDLVLSVHVRAVYEAVRAACGQMTPGGRIISIGSCFAERVPVAGISLYAMTKTALTGMTKALARDLGPRGITVNVVHPGPTDTDMNPANGENAHEESALTALGHYATGGDIAVTVAHLASEAGRYITGTSIAVDGGYAA